MTDRPKVQELLALRSWAIQVLGGAGLSPPPEVPEAAFRAFLMAERCAGPLLARLGGTAPPVLLAHALGDTQVVLAREATLTELARMGRERGFPVVALKSSAQVTRLPSNDVDVLVPQERLTEVAEYLKARDFRDRHGYREDLELFQVHLPGRARPGEMTVEVHHQLGDGEPVDARLWSTLRPLQAHSGCFRLPVEREAWHLLWHSVVRHPSRRGQLGDLLLISGALGDLQPGARHRLRERARSHLAADPLGRALAMAEGLLSGPPLVDEFRAVAAARYRWKTSRALVLLPKRWEKYLDAQWFELADGGGVGPIWLRWVTADGTPSARPWLFAVQRAAPRITRAGRILFRAGVFTLILPVGMLLGSVVRKDACGGEQVEAGMPARRG